jgi:PKD repeat protein
MWRRFKVDVVVMAQTIRIKNNRLLYLLLLSAVFSFFIFSGDLAQGIVNNPKEQSHFFINKTIPTANKVLQIQTPVDNILINAPIPASPDSFPLYTISYDPNNRFKNKLQPLAKIRNNVTTEQEALGKVNEILAPYGGLPSDAVLIYSKTTYGEEHDGVTGAIISRDTLFTTVLYKRVIDGTPIVGNSDLIGINLGENGELISLVKAWGNLEYTGRDIPIIPVDAAIDKLERREIINIPQGPEDATVNSISLNYYIKEQTAKVVLEPVWTFSSTLPSGDSYDFYVYARKFANFTATPTIVSTGDSITFTDASDASPVKWYWDFGDGTNSTLKNATHEYQTGGNYTVNLTVWNHLGSDTISRTEYIIVYPDPKPAASFTTNASWETRFPPEAVSFNDTSVGYITNWSWDFGDGTNSTEQSPTHVFNLIPGDVDDFYDINLTVTDRYGRTSMNYDTVYVQMDYHPDFTAEPTRGPAPLNVTFTDISPPLNHIDALWWDFGDGTYFEWYNDGTGAIPPKSVSHEYTTNGNYSVVLSIMPSYHSEMSYQSIKEDLIYVGSIHPPDANFTTNVTSGKVPLAVSFLDTSTESPAIWNWSFGDGIFSDEQNPVHIYTLPGTYTVTLQVTNIDGSDSEIRPDYILVQPLSPPVASFNGTPLFGKVPLTVVFNDTSSGSPIGWNWDFGDGTTSAEQDPVHEYGAAGNYTVSLQATNEDGTDTETRPDFIIVTPVSLPVADFTANTTSGNVPLAVGFTDISSGSPTGWSWTFGDGGTSAEQNPVHVYTTTGQFTVTLQVTNEDGSNATTKEQFITGSTLVLPVAEFTANTTSGNAPLVVGFTDQSAGSPVSWHWSFGDGATSAEQNPSHIYIDTGTYTVSLEVTNPDGSNTATKTDYITVMSNIQPPVASFTGKPTYGKAPLTVKFNDSSTGSPTSWFWDFGDGTNATQQNPVHIYTTAGKYTVSLTATNAGGSNTSTRIEYITVSGSVKPPVANFYGKPTSGKVPLSVLFTDTSTGSPTTWYWDFGDGTNATDRNPVHTYTTPGKYTVSLTVTNAGGSNTKTRTEYITVKGTPPPTANFYGKPTSGKSPLSVKFTDASTGSPTSWYWDFGDGTNDTAQHPVHSYTATGKYTVSLTASNAAGNTTKTRTQYISVTGSSTPTPTHTCTPSQCEPHEVPQVSGSITQDNKVRLDWDVITNPCLQGYKVVISKNNPNPKYPDDGYMFWITNRNTNYSVISSTDHYNGGDFGGYLQPGQSYYFSVTAVYSDTKVAGNVVELVYPSSGTPTTTTTTPVTTCPTKPTTTSTQNPCEPYTVPLLNGSITQDNKVHLDWDVITNPCLQGYKVVISKNNPNPKYPDDGYMFWITDRNTNFSVIDSTMHYNGGDFGGYLQPGETYNFSITAVYPDKKVPGNTIGMTYPTI